MRIVIRAGILAAITSVLWPGTAFAAGSGGGWDWDQLAYHAINLGILLFIIVRYAGPQVSAALQSRSEAVRADMDEAKRLHDEAKTMLSDYEVRLGGFEAQAETLLSEYRRLGEAERDRIISEAESEATRIRAEAVRVAESEFSRAQARVETDIIDASVAAAERVIREQLTEDDHRQLITEYFGQLESSVKN